MKKSYRWQFTLDRHMESEITHIENQFKAVFGRNPSKTDLLSLLVNNFKGKKNSTKK